MPEKINIGLPSIPPIFPSQKIENEEDMEKRKEGRRKRVEDEMKKTKKQKDGKEKGDRIDIEA